MISFDLSSEQQLLVDTVTKFASNELRKAARAADEDAQLPWPLIETGWTLGLVPSNLPEAYGGFGNPSALNGVLAAEALAYGDLSAALHILAPALAAYPIALCGTEEQKQTYLPHFAGDQFFPATAAFVEPSVQFDAHNMQTTAACQGDAYVLNGHKCLVPLAAEAELLLLYAAEAGSTQNLSATDSLFGDWGSRAFHISPRAPTPPSRCARSWHAHSKKVKARRRSPR